MLLDTCALLWLANDQERISPATRERIASAPVIHVSAISAFEIGVKHTKGKLILPASPRDWFRAVVEHHDLTVLALDLDACVGATELPRIHDDPCDRFIIAAAKARGLPVVTADPVFARYGIEVLL